MSAAPDDDDPRGPRSRDAPRREGQGAAADGVAAPIDPSWGETPASAVDDPAGASADAEEGTGEPVDLIEIPLDVDAVRDGLRLDRFIASRIVRLSRTRIQGIIADGRVRSAETGRTLLRPATRVRLGQRLIIERPAPREPKVVLDYGVLYADDDLMVLDKPAGLPVHPSASYHRHTLTYLLRERLGAGHGWELAHRLDRETSGVLVLGRRGRGASGSVLKRAFFERTVGKRYWAIARGVIDAPTRIDLPLGPAPGSRIRVKMGELPLAAGGQSARTDVRPLAAGSFGGEPVTLVEATPRTGRQHQIRVHLALIGHPLVGDKLYGLAEERFIAVADGLRTLDELGDELGIRRHALHAIALSLDHPRSGERLTFRAPWPGELAAIVAAPEDERCADVDDDD